MHGFLSTVLVGLLCVSGAAIADDESNVGADAIRSSVDANAIRDQQGDIRAAAEAGEGRYKDLPEARKQELFVKQDRVLDLIEGRSLTTELSELHQIELFNNLEAIQAIVNAAEDERMICRRERPIGTNRPRTVCKTVAQRQADRESVERDTGIRTRECAVATMGPSGCAN